MRNIYLLCCLLGFVLSSSKSLAQVDQCLVHLDKSFYVSGELMWFNLYLPVANRGHAFTIRVGIVDKNGATIETFFLATQGKSQANGYYKIPYNCNSGVYQLVFIGMESSTKSPVVLAKISVPIYNDLEKLDLTQTTTSKSIPYPAYTLNDLRVDIELDKAAYQNRETVQVLVRVKDKNGNPIKSNLSVSVSDWALSGASVLPKSSFEPGFSIPANGLSNQVFAQVKLQHETDNQGQNLVAIFFPQDWKMLYTSSKQEVFTVEMPSFVGSKPIQFLGHPNPAIQVQLLDPFQSTASPALAYTPGILQYLELSRQRKKIYQLYASLETQLKDEVIPESKIPLTPDRTLQMSEYESFEDLALFFREISTPLTLKLERKSGRYQAKMYNPGNFIDYPSAPIFILDGKVTRDADFIARLKTNQIEEVQLFYQPDQLFANFKAIGRSGVVNIRSKSGMAIPPDEEADVFKINGLQTPVEFPSLLADRLRTKNGQPFFRPQVYWHPNLETDAQGLARFSFVQTDDWSNFRIEVLVQAENGTYGRGVAEYKVSGN